MGKAGNDYEQIHAENMGSYAVEELLAVESIGYLGFPYMAFGVLLGLRAMYLEERLLRYVDRQYPKEAGVIRAHAWQMYAGSVGAKTLRALLDTRGISDLELARRARKAKRSWTYLSIWFVLFFVMFMGLVAYALLRKWWQ